MAESDGRVCGFVIGEVRDWEFGAPPCGWLFAIDVMPSARQGGVGGGCSRSWRSASAARA